MSAIEHSSATGIHKGAYIQASDPGAVGARVMWIDTTSGYVLKKRDEANTGWDTITTFSGGQSAGQEVCCGRLTLESGVPVSTTDQTAKTSIYWTPYRGDRVALYDGTSAWTIYTFSETSIALGTLTSGKLYDVFAFNSGGTPALELSAAWTSDTARADALTLQNGVYVKSGATTRRYLGTFRTTSTTTTEDSGGGTTTQVGGRRFVWNCYHRIRRPMKVIDTTSSWAYGTNTLRQANAASGNKVEYIAGLNEEQVTAVLAAGFDGVSNTSLSAKVGIGLDSTTAFKTMAGSSFNGGAGLTFFHITVPYAEMAGLGYHYLAWLERGAGGTTSTFLGSNDNMQSGLAAWING